MLKQFLDLVIAFAGLVFLSPWLFVAGVLIKLDSPGPVFYRGERIGQDGVPFRMYKLRTMVVNADRTGCALTHGEDPRITRVGRWLRKWKIDELPQLINVLRGEMSLVGPRPESPTYVKHYTPEQRRVLQVKPGMTGVAQIRFRHEETLLNHCTDREQDYITKIMPQKLALDLEYIQNRSLLLDIKLVMQTFLCLFQADRFASDKRGPADLPAWQDI